MRPIEILQITPLASAVARVGAGAKIYRTCASLDLYHRRLYRAETPFSWGSAGVLDAF